MATYDCQNYSVLERQRVVTIEPSAALEVAIATLQHRIGALVVLGADRRVIGILSERDCRAHVRGIRLRMRQPNG